MALPNVDLDLFVNSLAKGVAIGNQAPSTFSSFFGGLIKGADDQLDYQTQQQQNAIRQNQIEQLPIQNRLQEAQAVAAEANVAGYTADPAGFTAAQVAKQNEVVAEARRQELLRIKETELMNILQSNDGTAIGNAALGGEYADLFAEKPQLYKAVVNTSPTWPAELSNQLYQSEKAKVRAQYAEEQALRARADMAKAEQAFYTNADIDALANKLGVDPSELLLNGQIRTEMVGPKKPKVLLGEDGKQLPGPINYERDAFGDIAQEDDAEAALLPGNKPTEQKVFYYGSGKDKKAVQFHVNAEMARAFSNYQRPFLYANGYGKGQGGMGDLQAQAETVQTQRKEFEKQQQLEAEQARQQGASDEQSFMSTVNVKKSYIQDAQRVEERIRRNRAERETQAQPTQTATPRPTFDPSTVEHTPYTPPVATVTPVVVQTPAADPTFGPENRPAPALSPTPFTSPTASPVPTANPEAKRKEQQETAAARARFYAGRNAPQQTPGSTQLTPVQQAQATTAPTTIPTEVQITTPLSAQPSPAVVARVAAIPELRDVSALGKALIAQESAGNPDAVSPTGTVGLAQVTRDTANEIAVNPDRRDPQQSAALGLIRLESQIRQHKNPMLALVGYNAGPAVAALATRLAGTTEWSAIEKVLPQAVRAYYKDPAQIKEKLEYPYKVINYFPAFLRSRDDMELAVILKDQGILKF